MQSCRSLAWLTLIGLALFAAFPGETIGAEEAVKNSAESAGPLDWRAFLAPFHAVFLHLPIGFVTLSLILEIYAIFNPGQSLRRAIGMVLWISAISAILAAVLGFLRAAGGGYEKQALAFHEWTGMAVTVMTGLVAFIYLFAYPRDSRRKPFLAFIYRLMLVANIALLSIAGHYGGNLTHGSKYLFENAPEWVGNWVEETEMKVTDKIAEKTGLNLATEPVIEGPAGSGDFAATLRPIFEKKCFQCHGAEKQKGGYRMDTIEGLFAQGDSELDPIVAGRPLESYLVELITLPPDDDYAMPPEGKDLLTPEETLAIVRWIWDGARTEGEEEAAKIAPETAAID